MKYYRAICSTCGHTGKSDQDRRWLDVFFLPGRCDQCHGYKSRYAYSHKEAGWIISYGEWRNIDPLARVIWWNPSTWNPAQEWVDFDTGRVIDPSKGMV